ncbi:alpha/beta-hydrolase [Hypoxylon sp. NC1633]|nr:alpha/beta-hydrolase [Hypoxylon sp. NC1633]
MFPKTLYVSVCVVLPLCLSQGLPAPTVDLGYALYQGYYSETYDLNVYKGIRYAAPPVGKLRWQLPQPPAPNRSQVIQATEYASQCPQSGYAPTPRRIAPSGSEDCLFLNIRAPANRTMLPVLVYIRETTLTSVSDSPPLSNENRWRRYGLTNGSAFDPSPQIQTNNNTYITVTIQYRLGAFGFLSSAEVARSGVLNAGMHDQYFALQWVQEYIHLFGGDPRQVTIAGESAGGGSVMLLGMAYGGSNETSLFNGIIASSPYLPTQWEYNSTGPTEYYYRFANSVGCLTDEIRANGSVFECLVSADTMDLQNASDYVSTSGLYGQWAFIPVTDGTLIQERPTKQLLKGGQLNGVRVLSASNLNDGPNFTPRDLNSEQAFKRFIFGNYPFLTEENVTSILQLYSIPENTSSILVNSDGVNPPYSTTNSGWAYGWEQAAINLYAETTFACPSYWLADAYARKRGGKAWHYQFSVPPGLHADDLSILFQPTDTPNTSTDKVFRKALQEIWGNFIVRGDPTLNEVQATAAENGNISAACAGVWPRWEGKPGRDWMLNVNMTGGMPVTSAYSLGGTIVEATHYVSGNDTSFLPMAADLTVAEGHYWEGGRGKRCQLWADLGPWIKE